MMIHATGMQAGEDDGPMAPPRVLHDDDDDGEGETEAAVAVCVWRVYVAGAYVLTGDRGSVSNYEQEKDVGKIERR